MNPLIILAGPTASGKSETALELARHFQSEIISADSMQVYRGFDIGTAKPSAEIRQRVPHHLVDILDPDETFTAFDFKTRAQAIVRGLRARNKTPIMVGGTGLYLKTFIENYECAVEPDPEIRAQVKREMTERGLAAMHRELQRVDPAYAGQVNPNDPVRIERALTVYRQSGKPLSDFHRTETASADPYEFDIHLFLLERSRPDLYGHINRRVDGMIEAGLKEEVQGLLAKGYSKTLKPFQSIGYAQMVRHIEGGIPLDRARYEIQRETRHFAKRQVTWFRKMDETRTVPVEPGDTAPRIMDKILRLLPKTAVGLLLGLWLSAHPAGAATGPEEAYQQAVASLQRGDWDEALNTLRHLESSPLEEDRRRHVTYLLARALAHKQEHERAVEYFDKSRGLYPEIEDYILLHLARSQIALGRYPEALAELDRLAARFPDSLLLPRVHLLKADVHRLTHQPRAAVRHLKTAYRLIRSRFTSEEYLELLPDILERQIALHEQMEDPQGLYDTWRELYLNHPEHPRAQDAEEAMARLARQAGVKARPVSLNERARRLRKLLGRARFQTVIDEIESLLKPEGAVLPGRFYFLLADAHHGLRDRAAANRALEQFIKHYPDHPHVPKARFLLGRNLWNLGDREGARKRFQEVVDTAHRRDLKTEAQFILGKIYEEARNEQAALNEYRDLVTHHPQTDFGQEAGWQIGWVHYRAKRWEEAAQQFQSNLERLPEGDLADKNAFWLAKSLEQLNRKEDARKVYEDLYARFPYTYYGLQAANKLDGRTRTHILTRPADPAYQKISLQDAEAPPAPPGEGLNGRERFHFTRAEELIRLGFYKAAREEMRAVAESVRKNYNGVLWLSGWFNRAHAFADSMRLLSLFRNFKTQAGEKDLPLEFWKHFYPPAYFSSVHTWSREYNVDPLLAISLMRQESLYDTWSVSPAGARGLMQLMPQTAHRMHKLDSTEDFDAELLFDPDLNIRLGMRYLSGLTNQYGGNRIHILIAYNAGPHVLASWIRRFRALDDPDAFIESIPYPETRNYVKYVSRNYEIYKRLYGQEGSVDTADKPF